MDMAIIHNTTTSPSKLDLLRVWLPTQPWFLDSGRGLELTKTECGSALKPRNTTLPVMFATNTRPSRR
jgi:hypothetical protein